MQDAERAFQSLTGRLKTVPALDAPEPEPQFQSLTGRLKTVLKLRIVNK